MPNQRHIARTHGAIDHDGCPPQRRCVETLDVPQRFLIWCFRQWLESWRQGIPDGRALRAGFTAAAMPDGPAMVDAMMRAIVAGTRRQLDVRCLCCRFVSDDEGLFLDIIAAGQRDRDDLVSAAFSEVLAPASVGVATSAALALAGAMTAADLVLPLATIPGIARTASLRAAGRGLRLLQ